MNFSKLKDYLDILVNEYNTPSVDCIVCKDHEEIFRYHTGVRNIETKKEIDGNELYIIYSMTKMLTCTAALQLYEKGIYNMCDPISKYLPEFKKMKVTKDLLDTESAAKIASGNVIGESFKNSDDGYAKNQITVKDLFTMSAGLDYDLNAKGIKEALKHGKTSTRDLVGAMSKTILGFEPGTRYRYSLCHDIIGALIEIWSGKKLSEYMKENLFDKLGMKNTFFGIPTDEESLSRMASLYMFAENNTLIPKPLVCQYNLSPDYQSGGAGIISCTKDYSLFLDALACGGMGKNGNRILSPATVELMGTNHLKGKLYEDFQDLRKGYGYGLGVRVHTDKSESFSLSPLGEFGWDGAAGAFSMVDPKNKISLTYFQQVFNWDIKIQHGLRNALYSSMD